MRALVIAVLIVTALNPPAFAQVAASEAATRAAYVDKAGVVRWRENDGEVALFGADYCLMSSSDYRMAGYVSQNRKAMVDEDMAHFARMGWDGLRICSWGDWENSDKAGNLVVNDHVDVLDYVIAKAHERGIYVLLTPIHGYNANWPDQMDKTAQSPGFSNHFQKSEMGTNSKSIATQVNYIKQLLNHVNPYTGVALKDEPAILFVEMINEPIHHPEDLNGSVAYINTLVKAVRDTGSSQITFHNVSQDFHISEAIRESNADGVSFGWYPSSLVAGHTLNGNFLPAVDAYPDMLRPELANRPRIVYEFEQPDLLTGHLYPAMARAFRSVGAQFASIFAYDMLQTAPYNLGWQTHFINLVHTPKKAVSAIIAGEAMKRLPRMKAYGRYPDNRSFGDFRVAYEDDMSELNAADAYMNAGDTKTAPRDAKALKRVVGFGSSPVVAYEGTGAYFLDRVRGGVWRLEVYPDAVLVRDPFEQPQPGKIVSRLLDRAWPMTIHLPDLGARFAATPIKVPSDMGAATRKAKSGTFQAEPGIWLLSEAEHVDPAHLPARINRVGFDEYHINDPVLYPDFVESLAPKEFLTGAPIEITARVPDQTPPDDVMLCVRPAGMRSFPQKISMTHMKAYDYRGVIAAGALSPGLYEYAVTVSSGARATTFPGAAPGRPDKWPFLENGIWTFRVTPPGAPLRLFDPKADYRQLSFVRPEEVYRNPFYQIVPGETGDELALSLPLPDLGKDTPALYAAALYVGNRIAARQAHATAAKALGVKLKSVGGVRKTLDVFLIEKDGTGWATSIVANAGWLRVSVPLSDLRIARSIHIPSPYPGLWNYWREAPPGRGEAGDHIHLADVERLELRVNRNAGATSGDMGSGVAIESVWIEFAGAN
jgi:hypothetical protein